MEYPPTTTTAGAGEAGQLQKCRKRPVRLAEEAGWAEPRACVGSQLDMKLVGDSGS